jgi:hypothetical protein
MSRTSSTPTALWIAAVAFVGTSLGAGCGGPDVPKHDGYPNQKSMPWKRPKRVKLGDGNEAEVESKLSYPRRHRAKWYALELAGDGELTVKMEVIPLGTRESVNMGFEVLDSNFKVIMRLDPNENAAASDADGGEGGNEEDEWDDDDDDDGYAVEEEAAVELEWERTLYELAAGKYYLHLYLNGRMDETEFAMRLKFSPKALERESDFPASVAFLEPLPVVPAFDDTPAVDCTQCDCKKDARCKAECSKCERKPRSRKPSYCSKCDCKGPCKDRCKRKCGGETTEPSASVKARIIRPVASGGGTKITMNRGTSHGVQVGWKGNVVNKAGKAIEGGSFTVSKVKASECVGQVSAPPDAVIAAGRAVLRAP